MDDTENKFLKLNNNVLTDSLISKTCNIDDQCGIQMFEKGYGLLSCVPKESKSKYVNYNDDLSEWKF